MKAKSLMAAFLCLVLLLGTPVLAEECPAEIESAQIESVQIETIQSEPAQEEIEVPVIPAAEAPGETAIPGENPPTPQEPETTLPAEATEENGRSAGVVTETGADSVVPEPAPSEAPDAAAPAAPEAEATPEPAPTASGEVCLSASAEASLTQAEAAPASTAPSIPSHELRAGKNGTLRLAIGARFQLTANNAIAAGWGLYSVKSSRKAVATISRGGIITAKRAGSTTITVTMKRGKSTIRATVTVKVYDPRKATGIRLDQRGTVKVPLGTRLVLNATLTPSTAVSKLTWKTSSKKIAKVSKYGVVTPVKKGTCTITVTTNTGKRASVKIKVVAPLPAATPTPAPEGLTPETPADPTAEIPVIRTTEQQDLIADLSHYNGVIDWSSASQILDFVILRASVGSKADTQYVNYAQNCNIPFGAYHFVKAGTAEDAVKEATYFYQCATASGIQPRFFVADIEYETQTAGTTGAVCEAFLHTLRSLGASTCGLYIGQGKYPYVANMNETIDFLWMPRYGKDDATAKPEYHPIYECDLWQYTSKGYVPGISEYVDLNLTQPSKPLSFFTGKAKVDTSTAARLVVTASTLNIRAGANSSYTILQVAAMGERLTPVFNAAGQPIQAPTGWYAVRVGQLIGWVSNEYVTLG